MVPVISFIGWQNSGKTTIIRKIVNSLRARGLRVAVIKSTHHRDIAFDQPGTDTATYREAGAQIVSLLAPDQLIIMSDNPEMKLTDIATRHLPDCDIVIGEGFKNERHIAKIEVAGDGGEPLRDHVSGVIAVISSRTVPDWIVFHPDQTTELADFIVDRFLSQKHEHVADLYVNGRKIPLKGFVQDALAGTVCGFIETLKQTDAMQDIELRISRRRD